MYTAGASTMSQRGKILQDAIEAINTRKDAYGKPENNFSMIAKFWSIYLSAPISPKDVAMMMALLKIAREKSGAGKNDNLTDLCGYAALASEMREAHEN